MRRTILGALSHVVVPMALVVGSAGAVLAQDLSPAQSEAAQVYLLPAEAGGSTSASLAQGPSGSAAGEDKWEFIIAPYFFMSSIDGDTAVGRSPTVTLDVEFDSILDAFEAGAMGRFEVQKGRWGGIFEVSYVKLGASIPSTGVVTGAERITDAEFEQTMVEGFLSYRVVRPGKTSVDVFGGARYWDMDIDLDITGPLGTLSVTRGERWADPVFGVRLVHFVSDRWFIPVRGDLGGFGGHGATSDFTWNVQGGLGFEATKNIALVLQYKALGVDFDNDKPGTPDFFAYDAIAHGPLLGIVFIF